MAVRIRLFMLPEVKKFTKDTKKSKIRTVLLHFYNPRITLVELKHCNFNARIQKILIMKKIKILLGVLLVSVAVLCCLLIRAETSSELLDWNIEALSQSESDSSNCVLVGGFCFDMESDTYLYGMKLAD